MRDRGPGIDPEEQERIFERFVRGKRAGENQIRGSGIGLALVKHIAESHGGTISVKSPVTEDGRGSVFVLRVPSMRGEAPGSEPMLSPAGPSAASGAGNEIG